LVSPVSALLLIDATLKASIDGGLLNSARRILIMFGGGIPNEVSPLRSVGEFNGLYTNFPSRTGPFERGPIFSVASADYFLDLSVGATSIID
jgi:NAD-dependent SIR2 family protein deacetylase